MKIYRYSAHPPEFYRFKGVNAPCGIGRGPIAEDPGLWNLAWLSMEKQFAAYETNAAAKDLPMWAQSGLDFADSFFVAARSVNCKSGAVF